MKWHIVFLFVLVMRWPSFLLADEGHSHLSAGERLGRVSFPTSCSAAVQKPFERGVALMHSFEYESAENQFKEVARQDPACAMAYWGQALSLYHQLWSRPPKADLKRGADLLAHAQELKPGTGREREYIGALMVFYHDSDKLDHRDRAKAYAAAMENLYRHNPRDREAAVFYALSLLGSSPEDDPTLANPRKAVAILNKLFEQDPGHPGIAHYIIHACDNPQMANLGLAAARKYASIAPSSPHAVHMPSHIFARLGLWQDDIQSNEAALRAADKMAGMHLHTMHHKMHSLDFLESAYLQIGNNRQAKAEWDELQTVRKQDVEEEFQDYYDGMLAGFAARYALERHEWREAQALQPVQGARSFVQSLTFWANAVAAGHLHDVAAAQSAFDQFNAMLEATKKSDKPHEAQYMANNHDEAQAWLAFARGQNEEALHLLRAVADKQDKIGKGETETPAREMLADMLLEMNRPKEALAEYELSLKTDPNRFNGLYGAARAAEMAENKEKAASYYSQLIRNCQGSNSDRPELAKAKMLVASM
jgi:tetratricopeptide (TPR) repeat protein